MGTSKHKKRLQKKKIKSIKDVHAKFGEYRDFAVLDSASNGINIHKFIVKETKHRENHKFCELKPVGLYYNTFLDSKQANDADFLSNVLTPAEYSFLLPLNNRQYKSNLFFCAL